MSGRSDDPSPALKGHFRWQFARWHLEYRPSMK